MTVRISIFLFFFFIKPSYELRCQDNLTFTDVSSQAKVNYSSGYSDEIVPMNKRVSGGVACGDFNKDGYHDLYLIRGDIGVNVLLKNNGNGTFSNVTEEVGLNNIVGQDSGPLFFDYYGDGWLDLIVGSVSGQPPKLLQNNQGNSFLEIEAFSDIKSNTISITAGDYNKDGQLDLFMCHWLESNTSNHLWKNLGNGQFLNQDNLLSQFSQNPIDYSFTANFSDINRDGRKDLLITSDFGTSKVFVNDGTKFNEQSSDVINDENGMGAAVADVDNDGDFDWFVSSIYDHDGVTEGNWGASGNRLYLNESGKFTDATDSSGLRNGSWGWGSSFSDLNNDGHLDLIQVNGWPQGSKQFHNDSTRVFISQGNRVFKESASEVGLIDTSQGRGVVCFDYDKDGDLDIFISNYKGNFKLWRNDYQGKNNWINISLKWKLPNLNAVGSIIELYTNDQKQTREVLCGSNYVSQNPLEAHFGIGNRKIIDSLYVYWPNNQIQKHYNLNPNQHLQIDLIQHQITNKITAYPNPFSERVTIEVKNSGFEILKVFDIKGQIVTTLHPNIISSNRTIYNWESTQISSGIYFARIENTRAQIKIIKK